MIPAGQGKGSPPYNESFYSLNFNQSVADYGVYEFLAFGFPYIRNHFSSSVRQILVEKSDGDPDIGTGFLLEDRRLVTAAHCIKEMNNIYIPGWDCVSVPMHKIYEPIDERIDLAVLEFNGDPFPSVPGFRLQHGSILDPILTMGYPPIPGFDAMLVSETAHIAGHLKSSVGQISGENKSYLSAQDYYLITARVKGGNSGGPVISNQGKVVGVIAQLPTEAEGKIDLMGYGVVTRTVELEKMLQACDVDSRDIQAVPFTTTNNGICTI